MTASNIPSASPGSSAVVSTVAAGYVHYAGGQRRLTHRDNGAAGGDSGSIAGGSGTHR
jgi:hypothetical protein